MTLASGDIVWLVEVEFAGGVVRLATEAVDVTTADGRLLHFVDGLGDLAMTFSATIGNTTQETQQLSLNAVWPVRVAELVNAGHRLTWAPATVSRWIKDTLYESRRVLLRGRVESPTYGGWWEPVGCTISAAPWVDKTTIPPASSNVTGANFLSSITSLDDDQLGKTYPRVYGNPGRVGTDIASAGMVAGSRARRCDARSVVQVDHLGNPTEITNVRAVIADHHVTAQRVYVWTEDYTTPSRLWVRNGFDDAGHPIAFLPWFYSAAAGAPQDSYNSTYDPYTYGTTDFDSAYTAALGRDSLDGSLNTSQSQLYVAWMDDEDANRGGLSAGGSTISNAGEVIRDLVSLTGLRVDEGRMAVAADLLRGYRFDVSIDARCSPWEFVTANLLPLLPVSVLTSPEGLYLGVWRFGATPTDAVLDLNLDANPTLSRLGGIEEDSSQLANEFTLSYAKSLRTGLFSGKARLTGAAYDANDPQTHPDARCRVSQQTYTNPDGTPYVAERTATTIAYYDSASAYLTLSWWASYYGQPIRAIEVGVTEAEAWNLQPLDPVTVTDSDVGLDGAVALVESITLRSDGAPSLRLFLLDGRTA